MKRTYIEKGIWHLGGREKIQKGDFLPVVAGTIAKPLLTSKAASLVPKLLGGVVKKLIGGRKRRAYRKTTRKPRYA